MNKEQISRFRDIFDDHINASIINVLEIKDDVDIDMLSFMTVCQKEELEKHLSLLIENNIVISREKLYSINRELVSDFLESIKTN